MPAITPEFVFDLESNMRTITVREYERLLDQLWWRTVTREMTSGAKKERISWLLDSARIQRTGKGGNIEFEDIVALTYEIENENAAAGLKVKKEQLEDLDGNGIDLAAHWARQMGAYAAYWPQKMVAKAIRDNGLAYDGVNFFSAVGHKVNPFNPSAGTYKNRFTGAAAGIYPGAIPIDESVSVETAVNNIVKAIAYVNSIAMPNGEDPRMLNIASILVPPRLYGRAQQITNAKFIAQAAGSAAGSGDIEALIRNFGLGQPVQCPELGSAFGGNDLTYYLAMREISTSEIGALVYVNREPFSVIYHGPQTSAELARIREFQWTTEGRNTVGLGHPYLLYKAEPT